MRGPWTSSFLLFLPGQCAERLGGPHLRQAPRCEEIHQVPGPGNSGHPRCSGPDGKGGQRGGPGGSLPDWASGARNPPGDLRLVTSQKRSGGPQGSGSHGTPGPTRSPLTLAEPELPHPSPGSPPRALSLLSPLRPCLSALAFTSCPFVCLPTCFVHLVGHNGREACLTFCPSPAPFKSGALSLHWLHRRERRPTCSLLCVYLFLALS